MKIINERERQNNKDRKKGGRRNKERKNGVTQAIANVCELNDFFCAFKLGFLQLMCLAS